MVLMRQEIMEQPVVLKNCKEYNLSIIGKIVEEIGKRNICGTFIAARGTSDHAGTYGKYLIETTLGIPVGMAAPSVVTVYGKDLKLANHLVIGLSQSGKAADAIEVLKNANKAGALTVAITNDEESPMAQVAQFHLFCNAGLEKSVAATKTFTTELYLIALLVAEWAKDDQLKNKLEEIPGNIAKILAAEEEFKVKAERYRYMNDCFVLSRGLNYPIALEAGLKIQETCYVRAKAYAVSDFYHGPLAMIDKDMPVFVYAPNGPVLKDMADIAARLKELDAELVIISNNEELLEMGRCTFRIPDTDDDAISPFYNTVVAQLFACELSLAKGLNPDQPRSLRKVTITK
jgi:glucosamine--fructose-6-phosphate aminotransferase (isomerizing)